jgi:hypothetical protein
MGLDRCATTQQGSSATLLYFTAETRVGFKGPTEQKSASPILSGCGCYFFLVAVGKEMNLMTF